MSVQFRGEASLLPAATAAAPVRSSQPWRLATGGSIDRSSSIGFTFDGKSYTGHVGDTLASALIANGVRVVARSFKYHRPRGIYGSGPEEPNALVALDRGCDVEPNTRATTTELFDGLVARSQNRWPSLGFDLMGINDFFSALMPAGFYYKTFMWPGKFWIHYEKRIRQAAGMGLASRCADPSRYERNHVFCDVLVVGAGPAGIAAALAAGRSGARVVLAESEPVPGGALLRDTEEIDGAPAAEWVMHAMAELRAMTHVKVMTRSTVFGYYDNNVLAAVERVTDHVAQFATHLPRQRLHVIRARRVVLATGAIERPIVFENNDRPGVMLAAAVRTYVKRFAVSPGNRAVIFTNNDDAYRTALALHEAGVTVAAIVDSRTSAKGPLPVAARRLGIECLQGHAVLRAEGKLQVTGVQIVALDGSRSASTKSPRRIRCDVVAVSGGWSPTVHLHSQSGGRPVYNEVLSAFAPGLSRQAEVSAGAATGSNTLVTCLAQGHDAGMEAAKAAGFAPQNSQPPSADDPESAAMEPLWLVPGATHKAFVDIQDDVTSADLVLAHREGYVSVEHLKRYTTLGMGTDQGKTSNMNGLAIMAALRGQSIAETGTTTFRPPYAPVAIGVFAGRETGMHYQPVRRTPMHDWHVAQGAQMVEAGLWMRPRYYPRDGESLRAAYSREAAHVRNSVGLIDVSTLGKIDIQGPDAVDLLERVYANQWRSLAVGRVRYGLMLREDGIVLDDGTTARLGEHHYFMTTTTANAAKVLAHLEFLLQVVWPELRVHVTSVTEQWGAMALAGPRSRAVLARVIEGGGAAASDEALPHLGVASIRVAGVPCRVFRMTFSGELAYEIAAPADRTLQVWEAVIAAGSTDGLAPYGTEAMGALRIEKGHVASAELDGRTTAGDLGMGRLLSDKKDFIGRRLAQRPALLDPNRAQLMGLVPVDPKGPLRAGAQLVETATPSGITPMIGHVSSMTYSPALGHEIALAFVNGGVSRLGETLHAAFPLRNEVTAVRVVEPVFYDKEGARYRG